MRGFTIIEMFLAIAIMAVLSMATTPFLSSFLIRNNWHVATDRVVSEVYKAKNYSMAGKLIVGSNVWGVCMTSGKFRLFNGSCASPNFFEDYIIPSGVTVSGITEVNFDNLRGIPSAVTTINIVSNVGSSNITLSGSGMVDVN